MKIPKILILCYFTLLSLCSYAQKTTDNTGLFRDTTIVFDEYSIRLKDTYYRNKFFVRTTAVILNTTDQYMLIDKDSITLTTGNREEDGSLYWRTIVVPPKESVEFPLKFNAPTNQSSPLLFTFKGMRVTSSLKVKHPPAHMDLRIKSTATMGDFTFTVLKTELKEEGLAVRLRVQYSGSNFVKQNIYALALLSQNQSLCFNFRKYKDLTYLNPNSNNELLWLVFPRDCATATKASERVLVFKDVFTEYSSQALPEIKIRVSYLPDK